MTQVYLESNNFLTLGDGNLVSMKHQYETAYGESNGHVINDVTCRGPNMFRAQYLANGWRYSYRFSYDGAPIANGIWVSSGH